MHDVVALGVQGPAKAVHRTADVTRNITSGRTRAPMEGSEPAALPGRASNARKLPVFTVEQFQCWPGVGQAAADRHAAANTLHAVRGDERTP